jgi:superfamily II DNA or RNA helicase
MSVTQNITPNPYNPDEYTIVDFDIIQLNEILIIKHSESVPETDIRGYYDIVPTEISVNGGVFSHLSNPTFPTVQVQLQAKSLTVACSCWSNKVKMCEHQAQVLHNIMKRPELRIYFDTAFRVRKMREKAYDYGLEKQPNIEQFFGLAYQGKTTEIITQNPALFPFSTETKKQLQESLLPIQGFDFLPKSIASESKFIVFKQHKYFDHFHLDLYKASFSQDAKVKNPFMAQNPLDHSWEIEHPDALKFYMAIARFQNNFETSKPDLDLEGLKALVKNPENLPVFYHNHKVSTNISAQSVVPVQLSTLPIDLRLEVHQQNDFYEVNGFLIANEKAYPFQELSLKYRYFVQILQTMYLIDNLHFLKVIDFFRKNNFNLLLHESKFKTFQQDILAPLEQKVQIVYSYLRPANEEQIQATSYNDLQEKIVYLSEFEDYVLLTPVVRYGEVEIPVLSKKQIYAIDHKGRPFTLPRNQPFENTFIGVVIRQHPDFEGQLDKDCFYLHKKRFLDEGWFLDVFETFKNNNIAVLGFSQLKGHRLNASKGRVSITVNSGVNWFDTTIKIQFGKQTVSLKHLQKSIKNKDKFVELDDGTQGILPQEWIAKFRQYFSVGELAENAIRIPKVKLPSITELFEEEVLSEDIKNELTRYRTRLQSFENIQEVEIPAGLQADLRDYQKQGLNWLNFLDQFGFGGCLADDMGLGKTVQILAFILSQRNKKHNNTNLIVVPTSLIFNWQAEVQKFAPSLKILTIYGADRLKDIHTFDEYEIVLTSYGTLLSDILFLKKYVFNYIFLDESQAIKNPESQRYKAVRLLQSRNKIVLTGTPIENHAFDLYAQMSFACPGLLGTKQFFKDHYSMPIDKFKDIKRAQELQQKVSPFILRRTKKQVAKELPEKTEMVLFCEMGTEQRRVYEAYEKEFWQYLNTTAEGDIPRDQLHVLQGLTKLRQICDSPALLNDEEYYGNASAKIEVLLEEIESKSGQHKILVFSQFVSMLDLIKKELENKDIPFAYLTGQTQNRAKKVASFQENDEIRVFLISLKAGGVGLNLTEADYVYLVDPWWNPAVENQAIDRCYRIGQTKNVVAVRLICPDTIEEKIMNLQTAKKTLASDLVKTDSDMLKLLKKEDLLKMLSR